MAEEMAALRALSADVFSSAVTADARASLNAFCAVLTASEKRRLMSSIARRRASTAARYVFRSSRYCSSGVSFGCADSERAVGLGGFGLSAPTAGTPITPTARVSPRTARWRCFTGNIVPVAACEIAGKAPWGSSGCALDRLDTVELVAGGIA